MAREKGSDRQAPVPEGGRHLEGGRQAPVTTESDEVVLRDPRAIRALAHPARLAVIDALAGGEELTATECAEIAGLSPSAMSYHLRALEKWGIVERAAASGDARERPWRGRGRSLRIDSSAPAATLAVETALVDTVLESDREAVAAFLARQDREPTEWSEVMSVGRATLWLTADEARELNCEVDAQIERYRGRHDPASRPPGARRVRISHQLVPIDEPPASTSGP